MQLSPDQQKAIDSQKAQCPFCKIVKGEIPSKKVYEDDQLLAILDINPAAKGHLLIMPKEHYPIMPLIPPPLFEHLFTRTKQLSAAMKEGMLLFGNTLFIANGYAAGQQSSHFMLHLIPREAPDDLEFFQPKKGIIDKAKLQETFNLLKHNLPIMLRQRFSLYPIPGQEQPRVEAQQTQVRSSVSSVEQEYSSPPQPSALQQPSSSVRSPAGYTKETVIKLVESNDQLKQFVIQYPEEFKKQVQQSGRLKSVFANIDVDDIIAHFAPPKKAESQYSMDELVDLVNDNPKLKELLLKQTFLFTEKIQQVSELKELFEGVDVEALERAVIARDVHQEQDVQEILAPFKEKTASATQFASSLVDTETLKNLAPHLEIPAAENPAEIQDEDESITNLHAFGEEESSSEAGEEYSEEQQEEAKEQEQQKKYVKKPFSKKQKEGNEASPEEPEEKSKKGADLDLISRLHREMLQRQ
ncbi:HIT domain-containing protein [Candidatus Woesearchaeota archaeon]|nr:HIT domain-containing protein [Candidatus Woesearchaeota archaeon]